MPRISFTLNNTAQFFIYYASGIEEKEKQQTFNLE